jgi:hypothetical protein
MISHTSSWYHGKLSAPELEAAQELPSTESPVSGCALYHL